MKHFNYAILFLSSLLIFASCKEKSRVDKMEDMKLDVEHCALPLAAACTNLFPYVLFYLRKIFEN